MTISPFALNFQRRNFADIVYAQTETLHTKLKKWNHFHHPFKHQISMLEPFMKEHMTLKAGIILGISYYIKNTILK